MAYASDPTAADVKAYLGITATTYDTQIASILTLWLNVLNTQIISTYLADSTYDDVLESGKTLCVAGQVVTRTGAGSSGADAGTKIQIGRYTEDNKSSSGSSSSTSSANQTLFDQGMAVLKPYMSGNATMVLSDYAESSTDDNYGEFQLPKYDTDGVVIDDEEGTMTVF